MSAGVTLVLLPGMDGTGVLFGPLLDVLPGHVRPVVLSYPPDRHLGYRELAELLRPRLPAEGPWILLGESFGGPPALMLAAPGPPGLLGVILCSSFVRNPLPWLPAGARFLARPGLFRLSRPFILAKALVSGYGDRRLLALLREAHGRVSPAVMAARAREILSADAEKELEACPVPVFFIRGARDRVTPAASLRRIRRLRPQVKAFLLPGPHLILQTRPREAAEVIGRIAAGLSSGG